MKRERSLLTGRIVTVVGVAIAVVSLVRIASQPLPPCIGGDNPQEFHLWGTGSAFSYTFTYDPRKTDRWRFGTDGGTGIQKTN